MATRALVLSGGGPVGIAWEAGLLAGLAENGVDLAQADYIVGTSAGSFVGAHIAMGRSPAKLMEAILAEAHNIPSRSAGPSGPVPDLQMLFKQMQEAMAGVRPSQEVRAQIGAWALQAQTISEDAFIANFGRSFSGLAEDAWPERNYACTAVDALDGSFMIWNKASRVGMTRAVASSCSVPGVFPPITINGRRYIDGGMRSFANADIAKGYDTVVVVAVRGNAAQDPISAAFQRILDTELKELRDSGSRVELIAPDTAAIEAFGLNLMDSRRRPGSAGAGFNQGRSEAARLRSLWM
jgi:NTE family protein